MNVIVHDRLWSLVREHHQYRQLKRILELVDLGSRRGEMQMLCCGLLAFSFIYDNFSMSILIASFRFAHRNCTVHIVKFDHCLVYPQQSLRPLSPITFAIFHPLSWDEWISRSNYASVGFNDASILDWIWEGTLSLMIDDHAMVLPIHPVQHMSPCHQL